MQQKGLIERLFQYMDECDVHEGYISYELMQKLSSSMHTILRHGEMEIRATAALSGDQYRINHSLFTTEEGYIEDLLAGKPLTPACSHEWIGSGFPGGKMWCRHCDCDMPEEMR